MIKTKRMTTTRRKKMEVSKNSREDRELPTKKTGKMFSPGRSVSKLRKHL